MTPASDSDSDSDSSGTDIDTHHADTFIFQKKRIRQHAAQVNGKMSKEEEEEEEEEETRPQYSSSSSSSFSSLMSTSSSSTTNSARSVVTLTHPHYSHSIRARPRNPRKVQDIPTRTATVIPPRPKIATTTTTTTSTSCPFQKKKKEKKNNNQNIIQTSTLTMRHHNPTFRKAAQHPRKTSSSKEVKQRKDPEVDEDSESDLEIPYTQHLGLPLTSGCTTTTGSGKEPLRVGDVIVYTHPLYVAGNPEGLRIAQILQIDPPEEEMVVESQSSCCDDSGEVFPLSLDNGDLLPADHQIRRVKEYRKGVLRHHRGIFRPMDHFVLRKSTRTLPVDNQGSDNGLHGFRQQANRLGKILESFKEQVLRGNLEHGRNEDSAHKKFEIKNNHTQSTDDDDNDDDDDDDNDNDDVAVYKDNGKKEKSPTFMAKSPRKPGIRRTYTIKTYTPLKKTNDSVLNIDSPLPSRRRKAIQLEPEKTETSALFLSRKDSMTITTKPRNVSKVLLRDASDDDDDDSLPPSTGMGGNRNSFGNGSTCSIGKNLSKPCPPHSSSTSSSLGGSGSGRMGLENHRSTLRRQRDNLFELSSDDDCTAPSVPFDVNNTSNTLPSSSSTIAHFQRSSLQHHEVSSKVKTTTQSSSSSPRPRPEHVKRSHPQRLCSRKRTSWVAPDFCQVDSSSEEEEDMMMMIRTNNRRHRRLHHHHRAHNPQPFLNAPPSRSHPDMREKNKKENGEEVAFETIYSSSQNSGSVLTRQRSSSSHSITEPTHHHKKQKKQTPLIKQPYYPSMQLSFQNVSRSSSHFEF